MTEKLLKKLEQYKDLPVLATGEDAHYAIADWLNEHESEELVYEDGKWKLRKFSYWGGDRASGISGYKRDTTKEIELPERFLHWHVVYKDTNCWSREEYYLDVWENGKHKNLYAVTFDTNKCVTGDCLMCDCYNSEKDECEESEIREELEEVRKWVSERKEISLQPQEHGQK